VTYVRDSVLSGRVFGVLDRVGTDEFGKFMPEGTLFLFGLVTYDYCQKEQKKKGKKRGVCLILIGFTRRHERG
jgi:hypothetical protein